jgi:N,N'-diacetyllegionaminate synthase
MKNNRDIFIIAEAGVNHNGKLPLAKKLVDAACKAGADAVKFQTFKAGRIVSRSAPKAAYQKETTAADETQLAMIKRLELSYEAHTELFKYCRRKKILYLSTPFDLESIDFLDRLGVTLFKLPSGEITNMPYLSRIGCLKKRVLLSTGMATMREVENAVKILVAAGTPRNKITLLQCTSEYPAPYEDVNLKAMKSMHDKTGLDVGYSDHTLGIEASIAAAALGAVVIEKHFTLDRKMPGPDHKASISVKELVAMVRAIRNVERALGNGVKRPADAELGNRKVARKSIVAARRIEKGEVFTAENLDIKRPGTGVSPMRWSSVIGRRARRSFDEDELIWL